MVISGNLATSNLPLQADFSKLVAQALDWLDGQEPWKDEVVDGTLECDGLPPLSTTPATISQVEDSSAIGTKEKAVASHRTPKDIRIPSDIGSEASAAYNPPGLPLWIPTGSSGGGFW